MARIKGSFTVVPAQAGVILESYSANLSAVCRSRASGGDPKDGEVMLDREGSFPRKRG